MTYEEEKRSYEKGVVFGMRLVAQLIQNIDRPDSNSLKDKYERIQKIADKIMRGYYDDL